MAVAEVVRPLDVVGVPAERVALLWPYIEEFLEAPINVLELDKDRTAADWLESLKARDAQCWVAVWGEEIIGVAITQILVFPQRKVLGVPLLGAKPFTIFSWIDHLDMLKAYAREMGCEAIRGWGRRGWVSLLKPQKVIVQFDLEL